MQGSVIRAPRPCVAPCRDCSYHCVQKIAPVPTVAQALSQWFSILPAPALEMETLPLSASLGLITAQPVYAPMDVPSAICATHDGIAISFEDCRLRLAAGEQTLSPKEFSRCPMGSAIPQPFDTVAHAEQCQIHSDGTATLFSLPLQYQSVCLKGSCVAEGELLAQEKERLTPSHLALFQYAGITKVSVWRKPQVTIIPTGNDLLPPGSRPAPGQWIDCDSIYIKAITEQHGGQAHITEIVPDTEQAIENAIREALPNCQVLVLIGGVSKGERHYGDYTTGVIRRMGDISCHGVRLSPGGKHLLLGQIQGKPVIGMPGPPHAAIIMTEYVIPAILNRLLGCVSFEPPVVPAVLEEDLPPRGGGEDIWECRVVLTPSESGYRARMVDRLGETTDNFIRASGSVSVTGPRSQFKQGCTIPVKLLHSESEIRVAASHTSPEV